ncbi:MULTISPECIES: nucleoside permease [Flavobacterium]|jgi:NHS family xanthosine MFS transporter|uniref:MFS transporter, NHS family, xanthosine permease n=1 Tax=Flavobacterium lindanitolerans TaxID=428988 RepID=A0A497TUS5_9FLAO|nr:MULTISPECIES: nucleoside permease [Flavobacterium]PZQ78994.1 MAG: MFS transporter [Flavobacterium johnsoniae]KQS45696.1 nucleoside permease [Flavobacterium sp. Leaf359]MBL7868664.1 nucleoside permease [Flavobacterium lindanitolerans]OJX53428.1 MAG: MFS transporter [Flavobacterium sp. 38-13]PKW19956.1 MFS transporter, NHS family, xanthosine permease [Flavobacterium lindanitolerans]
MGIKFRLTLMSFLQFFVWGAWLITIGTYCFNAKGWTGAEFGAIFSTLGLSSLFMPALTGIIADKWLNAEKLYGILHILYGLILLYVPEVNDPSILFYVIFGAMICYMPTISLSNSIAYTILKNNKYDVVKVFPPIRVWGTIGFIVAMWITNIFSSPTPPNIFKDLGLSVGNAMSSVSGNPIYANQFYIAAFVAILLGIYSFTLPKCPPQKSIAEDASFVEQLGLNAFKLFSSYKMALFFIFSMFLGGALQLTNMYGDAFLNDFAKIPEYKDSFVVEYSTIIMSISQVSETLFILAIPFFLKRFGIKQVMLFSMIAWVLRFGLFAYGDPVQGLWMIILSCIVYGMAFDFFNISGSLFVETTTDSKIRASAQGLFMMMTNGVGAYLGSVISGYAIDKYFTHGETKDWHSIWLSFALYALIISIAFAVMFKHKHKPEDVENISH